MKFVHDQRIYDTDTAEKIFITDWHESGGEECAVTLSQKSFYRTPGGRFFRVSRYRTLPTMWRRYSRDLKRDESVGVFPSVVAAAIALSQEDDIDAVDAYRLCAVELQPA